MSKCFRAKWFCDCCGRPKSTAPLFVRNVIGPFYYAGFHLRRYLTKSKGSR